MIVSITNGAQFETLRPNDELAVWQYFPNTFSVSVENVTSDPEITFCTCMRSSVSIFFPAAVPTTRTSTHRSSLAVFEYDTVTLSSLLSEMVLFAGLWMSVNVPDVSSSTTLSIMNGAQFDTLIGKSN